MTRDNLTFSQPDISVAFYDACVDSPKMSFEAITKRVFGSKGCESKALEKECRKMYELAHS
jgi:hypothetical protein